MTAPRRRAADVRGTGSTRWTVADIGDQRGRTAVITGANTGIGFEAAKLLADQGARVVLACRDVATARHAAARIRTGAPWAEVDVERLDLASLASVRAAAERIRAAHPRLDLLINNAGVMKPPSERTEDGFDPTFGVNHLGHFALTGLLLDRLLTTPGSRIVTVSSLVHRYGRVDLDGPPVGPPVDDQSADPSRPDLAGADLPGADLAGAVTGGRQAGRPRRMWLPYPSSKLANLLFTYELQRRLTEAAAPTIAVAAHPGIVRTGLARNLTPPIRVFMGPRLAPVMWWLIQGPRSGAWATVRAAVDPNVRGGCYYGPSGLFHSRGRPVVATSCTRSLDADRQRRLWALSERLTGITFAFSAADRALGADQRSGPDLRRAALSRDFAPRPREGSSAERDRPLADPGVRPAG